MDKKWYMQSDFILGAGAVSIVGMLVVPLPGFILDLLILFSLALSLLILLTSLSIKEPSEFSVFPSLLLISTIYRLALNVSTTRQILSKGPAINSAIIDAFGSFIVGSESGLSKYVVGFIIFLILVIVQVLVITKGATRISEVAARFTLDALPGKQMAIDMELSTGNINEAEARKRRKKIEAEVDFYGSMDGASKFVQGDVRAGLIITAINLIGGVIIGASIRGESFISAVETYGKFTIGDGLVSQIPALLTTVATGIIVTRSGSESDLAKQFKTQLFANSKVLYVVAASMGLGAFIPGLPFLPMVILSGSLAYLAYSMEKTVQEQLEVLEKKEKDSVGDRKPRDYYDELRIEPIEIEFGYHLVPLVDASQGGTLMDQISNLRGKFARESGIVIPPIRILDNLEIPPDQFTIKINGVEVGSSTIRPEKLMAMPSAESQDISSIEGESFMEPAYGRTAKWISADSKGDAESKGFIVVDASTVIITYLRELLATHASSLLGREEVKKLLDHYRSQYPTLIQELEADKPGNLGMLQQVLQNLLREGLGIRNLVPILETVANKMAKYPNPYVLTEFVRQNISNTIVKDYMVDGKLQVIVVEGRVLDRLNKSLAQDRLEGRDILVLPPDFQRRLLESVAEMNRKVQEGRGFPIYVVNREVRMPFAYFLAKEFPPRNFAVLALEEVHSSVPTMIAGELRIAQATAAEPAETI